MLECLLTGSVLSEAQESLVLRGLGVCPRSQDPWPLALPVETLSVLAIFMRYMFLDGVVGNVLLSPNMNASSYKNQGYLVVCMVLFEFGSRLGLH